MTTRKFTPNTLPTVNVDKLKPNRPSILTKIKAKLAALRDKYYYGIETYERK